MIVWDVLIFLAGSDKNRYRAARLPRTPQLCRPAAVQNSLGAAVRGWVPDRGEGLHLAWI